MSGQRVIAAPGAWLAVLGGGQLGRMFAQASQRLGFKVLVLDPDPLSPAGAVADAHLQAGYEDAAALRQIADTCAGVTTEFENVPAAALDRLSSAIPARPSGGAVRIAQDRVQEKSFLANAGSPVAPFKVLRTVDDCSHVPPSMLPGIVKTARMGYDGKGQVRVDDLQQVLMAFHRLQQRECVVEQRIDLAMEISALVARSASGDIRVWALAENRHRDGILDVSIVPARIDPALAARAREDAIRVAQSLNYVGVLCVEMFVAKDGRLLVNEIAPRPHNSGHWTIDGAYCSQFEQQCRVLAGLPLGDVTQHSAAVMVNVLGDAWFDAIGGTSSGEIRVPDWAAVLAEPRASLHLYGKAAPRRGRKMGHVTCLAASIDEALAAARRIKRVLAIPADGDVT